MIRVNKYLFLFLGLFLAVSAILVFLFQKFTPLISHITYYCQSLVNNHAIPIPYYLSTIPFILLFVILTVSLIKFLFLNIKVYYLKNKLNDDATELPIVLNLIKQLKLEDKTIVIQSDKHVAFCLGIKNPKIYISTGLLSILSKQEIETVLRHEQYHLENYDTFTMIVASVTRSMFPFFPLVNDLIKRYQVEREIQADKFAINKVGSAEALLSTLKKLLISPSVEIVPIAAIADQDTIEPRIYSLLNKPFKAPRLKLKNIFITVLSAFMLGVLIVSPVQATELHHDHYDIMVLTSEKSAINACAAEEN